MIIGGQVVLLYGNQD